MAIGIPRVNSLQSFSIGRVATNNEKGTNAHNSLQKEVVERLSMRHISPGNQSALMSTTEADPQYQ